MTDTLLDYYKPGFMVSVENFSEVFLLFNLTVQLI